MAIIQQIENGEFVDTSASANSLSASNRDKTAGGSLDKDAFLQLLVAQMKYQDALEPTDNTEYISQLATFSQLEEMQNLNQTMTEGSAYNLVGKHVFVKVTNNKTGETFYDHGMVEYIMRENGKVYVSVNDSLYNIEDLDTVADPDYYTASMYAKTFTEMVGALPKVSQLTVMDEEKVKQAREVFDAMTDYQKSFVKQETIDQLQALEARMKEMKDNLNQNQSNTPKDEGKKTE